MSSNLVNSITLITSVDSNNKGFGTGFVIRQDEGLTCVLTCAHIVSALGGKDKIQVEGNPAKVVASGDSEGLDIAILTINRNLNKTPLSFSNSAKSGNHFFTFGFDLSQRNSRIIQGTLGDQVAIENEGERTSAWLLEVDTKSGDFLEAGYSGAPVVDMTTGQVVGVVSHMSNKNLGLAIAVEGIKKILSQQEEGQDKEEIDRLQVEDLAKSRLEELQDSISLIEQQLLSAQPLQSRKALEWLSNQKDLSKKACNYTLTHSAELKDFLKKIQDSESKEETFEEFCWEVEKYVESIYFSLLTQNHDLLDEPVITPSLPIHAYETALSYLKRRIPKKIDHDASNLLKVYIDYLVSRIG